MKPLVTSMKTRIRADRVETVGATARKSYRSDVQQIQIENPAFEGEALINLLERMEDLPPIGTDRNGIPGVQLKYEHYPKYDIRYQYVMKPGRATRYAAEC